MLEAASRRRGAGCGRTSSARSSAVLHRGAGAYICGEETALLESLEGNRGQPRPRPPFPPVAGLYMQPTLINNLQTIATVPAIIELGPERYAELGVASAGTVVFSLSGNVNRPETTSSRWA